MSEGSGSSSWASVVADGDEADLGVLSVDDDDGIIDSDGDSGSHRMLPSSAGESAEEESSFDEDDRSRSGSDSYYSDATDTSGSDDSSVIPDARPLLLIERQPLHPQQQSNQPLFVSDGFDSIQPVPTGPTATETRQRRRRWGNNQHSQTNLNEHNNNNNRSDDDSDAPSHRRRRRQRQRYRASVKPSTLYLFGATLISMYLIRPDLTPSSNTYLDGTAMNHIPDPLTDDGVNDPWHQGAEFTDRQPPPQKLRRRKNPHLEDDEEGEKGDTGQDEDDKDDAESTEEAAAAVAEDEGSEAGGAGPDESVQEGKDQSPLTESEIPSIGHSSLLLSDWWLPTAQNGTALAPSISAQTPVFFWFLPGSGGGIIINILEKCYGVSVTRSVQYDMQRHNLYKWFLSTSRGENQTGTQTNRPGVIEHAMEKIPYQTNSSLFPSILATPKVVESVTSIYSNGNNSLSNNISGKGRCISIFMHPIRRALRSFRQFQVISSQFGGNGTSVNLTIEVFARSSFLVDNELVRSISNRTKDETLEAIDLEKALEFVSRKCLLGIVGGDQNSLRKSVDLFIKIFNVTQMEKKRGCSENIISSWTDEVRDISGKVIPLPPEESVAWKLLMEKNAYDIKLFEKATELFDKELTAMPLFLPNGTLGVHELLQNDSNGKKENIPMANSTNANMKKIIHGSNITMGGHAVNISAAALRRGNPTIHMANSTEAPAIDTAEESDDDDEIEAEAEEDEVNARKPTLDDGNVSGDEPTVE